MKVQQQADWKAEKLHVTQQLRFVDRMHLLDSLNSTNRQPAIKRSNFNSSVNAAPLYSIRTLSWVTQGIPRDGGGRITLRLYECRKPVIAAINGAAVGVGATMTLPMDVRIASEKARFGFVFARRGIVPEAASSWFLPRVVGIGQAMEWVATGRLFGAAEALAGRLVSRVVPESELLPAARALARDRFERVGEVALDERRARAERAAVGEKDLRRGVPARQARLRARQRVRDVGLDRNPLPRQLDGGRNELRQGELPRSVLGVREREPGDRAGHAHREPRIARRPAAARHARTRSAALLPGCIPPLGPPAPRAAPAIVSGILPRRT